MTKKTREYYLAPFRIIKDHKMEFVLWMVFVILAGQLGTIINIVSRCIFGDMTISQSLLADSVSGNFYTFSLVLIASLVGSYFIRLLVPDHPEYPEHRRLIVPFVALALMLMLFSAVFFSFQTRDYGVEWKSVAPELIRIDICQVIFFALTVIVAIFAFGLDRMYKHREYDEMAKYRNEENKNVAALCADDRLNIPSGGPKL